MPHKSMLFLSVVDRIPRFSMPLVCMPCIIPGTVTMMDFNLVTDLCYMAQLMDLI